MKKLLRNEKEKTNTASLKERIKIVLLQVVYSKNIQTKQSNRIPKVKLTDTKSIK